LNELINRCHLASSKVAKPATMQSNAAKTKVDLSNGLKNLSVEEPVKIRSKNLDVLAEYKKVKRKSSANFVVIGAPANLW
jgi:elongation factor 1 alpha-like protein